MSAKVRKQRMISLRLSEVEYEALHALYPTYGAHSVSDFARIAMQRFIGSSLEGDDALLAKIRDLDSRLKTLEFLVASLEREKTQPCQLTTAS